MIVETRRYEELPKKQQAFVDFCVKLGDKNEAYEKAGYSVQGRAWKANARSMYLSLSTVIKDRIDVMIGDGAILALNIVKEIMQDPEQPGATRLKASQDYLNRAGYDKPVETNINIADARTPAQLDQEIQDLLKASQDVQEPLH